MNTALTIYQEQESMLPVDADDPMVIDMWLAKGKHSAHTQDAYRRDIRMFLDFMRKPLKYINLLDVQAYKASLVGKPATINRRLTVVKSLFSFAHTTGYITYNIGKMVELEETPDGLAQRILSETQVQAMIALEKNTRNRVILKLLYQSGVRVSELVGLCWADIIGRDSESAWLHIIGKGSKSRSILIRGDIWQELLSLRGNSPGPEIFLSRQKHGDGSRRLDRNSIQTIVRAAAQRAGIDKDVSPHFLRHSCASHALERGASIALVWC